MAFWQKQKERIILELDSIVDGQNRDELIGKIDKYFGSQIKPKEFMGERSEEIRAEREFELNCILLSEYTNKSVKEMTTKEYFTLLNYRNEQIRKRNGR